MIGASEFNVWVWCALGFSIWVCIALAVIACGKAVGRRGGE